MSDMEYRMRYQRWMENEQLEPELRQELEKIAGNDREIYERFYQDLTFGTAGLRGMMGVTGRNRQSCRGAGRYRSVCRRAAAMRRRSRTAQSGLICAKSSCPTGHAIRRGSGRRRIRICTGPR